MKSRGPFLILVALLGAVLMWVLLKKEPTQDTITPEEVHSGLQDEAAPSASQSPNESSDIPATLPTSVPAQKNAPAVEPIPFETRMREISECLNVKPAKPDEESVDMDFFSLNSAFADKFGGYRDEDDLWASTELTTSSGERRRILTDFRDGQPALRYVSIQADGSQKNLDLSTEQMNEPSEALLASLESDGTVTARARARVVNYVNGQQLTLREVDGKIYSFQLTQGDKTYKCDRPTTNGNPICNCADRF